MIPGRGRGQTAAVAAISRRGARGRSAIFVDNIAYVDDGTISVKFSPEQLLTGPVHSDARRIGCVPWSLTLSSYEGDTKDITNVNVTVHCLQNASALQNFDCNTRLTIRLVPQVPNAYAFTVEAQNVPSAAFYTENLGRTYVGFTTYDALRYYSEQFADGEGRYEIEVRIQVRSVHYDLFPENEFDTDGDIVLIAGDRRFHVDKQVLMQHASYFYGLFSDAFSEAGKKEVTLTDVESQDFLQFLRAIYPSAKNATVRADNVEALVVLADKFTATALSAKCQDFLCSTESDNNISKCDKLKLAELGHLNLVTAHVMKRILRTTELNQILEFDGWSNDTLQMLQRKKKSIENSVNGVLCISD